MIQRGPMIPACSLATGIAISSIIGLPWWVGAIPIALGILTYVHILNSSIDPIETFRMGKWHAAWVVLIFLGAGMLDESLSRPMTLDSVYSGGIPEKITCEVSGIRSMTYGDRIDVTIQATNGAKARIRSGATDLSEGDIISIPSGFLREISADTTDIGKKTAPMLKASGILYTGRVNATNIETIGRSHSVGNISKRIRRQIEISIERSHLNKQTSSFLNAILMGDKTGLDEQTRLTFAHGGTAHMLALSGLHLGILAGFLLLILWPIKFCGKYKWGYAITIVLLWIYVVLTGMSHSSVRACIMTTIAFIAIIAERKNFAANALWSACLIILLFEPTALFDAGFQLSVVCVGALIAFASTLNPIGHKNHPVLYYVCGSLIATMVATGASWVLTSYYFSQIPLMFLPGNLVLLPLLPIYLSIAVIFVVFLCAGTEIGWIGYVLDKGYEFMLWIMEKLSCGTEFVVDYQLPLRGVIAWLMLISAFAWWINWRNNESDNRIS